jgi:hypothetical protein
MADDGPFMPYCQTVQRFMLVTPPSYAFQTLKCRFWSVIRPAGRGSFGSSNEGLASPFLLSQSAANPPLEQFSTPPCRAPSSSHSTGRYLHFNAIHPWPPRLIQLFAVICRSGYRSLQGSLFAPSSSSHEAPVFFFGTPSRFSTMRWPRAPGVTFSQWNVTSSLCSLIVHTLASTQEG